MEDLSLDQEKLISNMALALCGHYKVDQKGLSELLEPAVLASFEEEVEEGWDEDYVMKKASWINKKGVEEQLVFLLTQNDWDVQETLEFIHTEGDGTERIKEALKLNDE